MMLTLAEALNTKLTEARIRIYAQLLSDVPTSDLKLAFHRAANERPSGFFPSPGELRKYVNGTEEDDAILAWAGLRRAASVVGSYSSLEVSDGAAAAALEAVFGSWPEFCLEEEGPAMHARRQEFLAAYRAARRAAAPPRRLAGLCEASPQYAPDKSWVGILTCSGQVTKQLGTGQKLLGGGKQ